MGAAKAALESTSRYLARELGPEGVRVNLVAAGPLRSMAMKSIPGSEQFEEAWEQRAPLGWSVTDTEPAGKAVVALLSDWFPATTGEIVPVDGGFHAVGVWCRSCPGPAAGRGPVARRPQQRGSGAAHRTGPGRTPRGAARALLRRPRGPRRRDAVPRERHPRTRHPPGAARGGGPALPPLRRRQPDQRPEQGADRRPGEGVRGGRAAPADLLGQPQLGALRRGRLGADGGRRHRARVRVRDLGIRVLFRLPAVPRGHRPGARRGRWGTDRGEAAALLR